ncbi:Microfibrillar-associated protein 2 [Oryzias melastigma]|uniref:Microfibrillar-associated protein 2 n=1 Tax=Oryzias melastigma TaxID=30732 RepID=A0A834KY52_ORYME|nr:Microfibrillar-associated protein 2 [Oryzias melastigma]
MMQERRERRGRRADEGKEEKHICGARKVHLLQLEGMGSLPVVLLLCSFHVLTAAAQVQPTETPESTLLPSNCREEMYPCTRMYSVHRPVKTCVGYLCLYRCFTHHPQLLHFKLRKMKVFTSSYKNSEEHWSLKFI